MSEQIHGKLNRLMARLADGQLVSSRWLREQGYASNLVARYVASGWLRSPARGVYHRSGGTLFWEGVVRSLQQGEQLPLHVGGRFALAWRGHEHFLRLGEPSIVTLYGPSSFPSWAQHLNLPEQFIHQGRGPFALNPPSFVDPVDEDALFEKGLERVHSGLPDHPMVLALPERAMLELCDEPPSAALVYEADAVMQGLTGLRPAVVSRLLSDCQSIKAKRLFMALADRHGHAWTQRIAIASVNFGSGKRALVANGRLHSTYQITLPADLDEHLG